jgi:ATP-dependent Zn protease
VVLIGATNFADRIDPALRRAGRLDRTIVLRAPDTAAFAAMLRTHLGADLPGADLVTLARLAPGPTGADAAQIVRDARAAARLAGRALTLDDLLGQVLPTETRPRALVSRIARHEAAHAVVGLALGAQRLESLTLAAPDAAGAARFATIAGRPQTRAHFEALILTGLVGRAADEAFGEAEATAGGGPGSDLANASALLAMMHGSFGLGGTLVALAEPRDAVALLGADADLRATVERDLQRLYARAQSMVAERRTEIELVAAALVRRRFLTDDARALLTRVRRADPTRLVAPGRTP